MLKLLLNHWHAHREPAPFVLTDDPLYCAHLSTLTSKLPEVYSVNRVNPIFEEDEGEIDEKYNDHNRTSSENETRSSDDTGYTSGHRKQHKCLAEDAYSFDQTTSTDSDEPSKSVTISADVHRVSYPDDVIVLSTTSSCSCCASSLSINSNSSSQEPFDSLTASHVSPSSSQNISIQESMKIGGKDSQQTDVKKPIADVGMQAREKLEKLLQHGNQSSSSTTSSESKDTDSQTDKERDFEKTRQALMKSLTRALNQKVPKTSNEESTPNNSSTIDSVTRSDSSKKSKSSKSEDSPEKHHKNHHHSEDMHQHLTTQISSGEAVTRQDESASSHSSSSSRKRQHRTHSSRHHSKHVDDIPKPMTLHQLLPGHWSYDNIYLPQMMPGVCYHCFPHGHHHNDHHHHHGGHHYPVMPVPPPTADIFYPMLYHHKSRSRHSWAPRTDEHTKSNTTVSEQHTSSHSSKEGSSSGRRYSPDGSSRETESDVPQRETQKFQGNVHERRSLRVPKKCKCEFCLSSAFDGRDVGLMPHHFPTMPPPCTCCYYPHRKVKFASDTDLSKHPPAQDQKGASTIHRDDNGKHNSVGKNNGATFHINLHRLNGHVNEKSMVMNEDSAKSKINNSTISRGQKEPVKMEDIYRSYPINFKDWEAHYKRTYLHKRRKRALNMIGMAIGIVLVVGVAIAVTFIFLRLKRPT